MKKLNSMSKYINPFFDWSFKRIFGNDSVKDILIGFLNALFAGKHVIVDVKYENVERQYDDQDTRAIIYDVFCTTDKGERLIVEMQNRSQKFFKDRALYYMSRAVSDQGNKPEWNYELNAVYGIFFLNFKLEDIEGRDLDESLTEVVLAEKETGVIFNPKFQQYYIELPRFNKTEKECLTEYDKWIYILKHLDTMETMPFEEDRNAVFAKLAETAARANLTKEERARYDEQWRNYNDYYNTIDFAKEEEFVANEKELNFVNRELVNFIIKLSKLPLSDKDHNYISSAIRSISDLERVGDYAENIVGYAKSLSEEGHGFSLSAVSEIKYMQEKVNSLFENVMSAYIKHDFNALEKTYMIEEEIDKITARMESNHITRLEEEICTPLVGAHYLSLSSNAERIADHLVNVAKTIEEYR